MQGGLHGAYGVSSIPSIYNISPRVARCPNTGIHFIPSPFQPNRIMPCLFCNTGPPFLLGLLSALQKGRSPSTWAFSTAAALKSLRLITLAALACPMTPEAARSPPISGLSGNGCPVSPPSVPSLLAEGSASQGCRATAAQCSCPLCPPRHNACWGPRPECIECE